MNKNGKDLLKIDWVNYFILDFNIILWMFAEKYLADQEWK